MYGLIGKLTAVPGARDARGAAQARGTTADATVTQPSERSGLDASRPAPTGARPQ